MEDPKGITSDIACMLKLNLGNSEDFEFCKNITDMAEKRGWSLEETALLIQALSIGLERYLEDFRQKLLES